MRIDILAAAAGIGLVDIVLSGDNALVIGAAASKLPRTQRYLAVFWGGLGAVILRIALAVAATEMLRVPLLQAAGGAILLVIATRLLLPGSDSPIARGGANRLWSAMLTILIADATMSLDNVLAVGALANGNIPILIGGLAVSVTLLFVASAIIARLMETLPWLLDLASLVLAWTAANLVLADPKVGPRLGQTRTMQVALHAGFLVFVLLVDLIMRAVKRRRAARAAAIAADDRLSSAEYDARGGQRVAATGRITLEGDHPGGLEDSRSVTSENR